MIVDPREPAEGEEHVEEAVSDEEGLEETGSDSGEQDAEDGEEAHGDEEGDGEGSVDDEPAQRKPSRAQSRIQTLTRTLAEEKAERQRIDRELADLRAEQRQRQQAAQQESPTEKAARRALMSDVEIMREDLQESEKRTSALLHQQAIRQQEESDKLLYNSILRESPHLKKYEAEVEKVRKEQHERGVFVPREVLLDLAIGRAARAAATRAAPKAKKDGQRRIEGQTSRPAQARGDTATARGKQGDSPEKRLENVPI
jgi:hypothetical protein